MPTVAAPQSAAGFEPRRNRKPPRELTVSTLPAVEPMPPDAVRDLDRLRAIVLIATRLKAMPAFVRLYKPVADELATAFGVVQPAIRERWVQLSPEGRGAVIAAGSPGFFLQPEDAQSEASSYLQEIDRLMKPRAGVQLGAYRVRVAELLAPLRVEGLLDALLVVELKEQGLFDRSKDASPLAGPAWDGLEAGILRALTDLGPVEASVMPLGAIQARARRKLGSLTRHLTTYDLPQRVDLWILNRVYGKSALQIASDMQKAGLVEQDRDPLDRVRRHLRETKELLGTQSRRAEVGAFDHWNSLAN